MRLSSLFLETNGNDLGATFPLQRQEKEEHGVWKCLVTLRMAGVCVCYLEGEFLRDKIQGNTNPLVGEPARLENAILCEKSSWKTSAAGVALRIFGWDPQRALLLNRLIPRNRRSKRSFFFSGAWIQLRENSLTIVEISRHFSRFLSSTFNIN